ncbi:hypothetical protein AMJ71_08010 [candidate division TA06 bacterium SM1_40]|uniref:Uncharacterized protein n=1 Tax=candidate division TA06 bacterium SM1_40 TaxID=1703773 RepID=A0A0S8JIF7_UNCT6|nr:MAG: hypothetical protein AMJ71_08010 [candidate division TA06 bacterium SM1_40]
MAYGIGVVARSVAVPAPGIDTAAHGSCQVTQGIDTVACRVGVAAHRIGRVACGVAVPAHCIDTVAHDTGMVVQGIDTVARCIRIMAHSIGVLAAVRTIHTGTAAEQTSPVR